MIRLVVAGACGKMGSRVLAALRADRGFTVAGATERPDSPQVGADAGTVSGGPPLEVKVSGSMEEALKKGADVAIDFTAPSSTVENARACAGRGVALVVGTTGLSPEANQELAALGRKIPLLIAPNMSVGVNVLFRLVKDAARALGSDYEIEVVELHHRMKRDAPSGTALRLAEVAAEGSGLELAKAFVYQRHGDVGPRKPGTIGIQTLRGGDVVGDHTVHFLADGERLELSHRATSRDNFARGALRAARFLVGKPAGLYGMQDVLGFEK